MKTYISGPLAGLPEVPREEKVARFKRAAETLHSMGLECGDTNGHTWDCWLRWDILGMLQECDSIALLPGWESSKGARLELHIAQELGWNIIDLSDDKYIEHGA
jgi:hypothetical protein